MSTTATVFVPRQQATPRGARLVGLIFNTFANIAARRRAARQADVRAAEADEVRRYARNVARQDPGFAADLFAAADRHTFNNN